jgi:DNA-binding NarL/FixJ family response regulator
MNAMRLNVMLVEDHAVVRDVLREFVGSLPRVATCSATASAEAALERVRGAHPDLMLIDLSLPGMNGIDLVREMRNRHRDVSCLMLSGHGSASYAQQALSAGARGYVLKGDPLEIERGIDAVVKGECYVSPGLATTN